MVATTKGSRMMDESIADSPPIELISNHLLCYVLRWSVFTELLCFHFSQPPTPFSDLPSFKSIFTLYLTLRIFSNTGIMYFS